MKQTNINIDEIKRFPTVTNPIKADDLHTPQAYAYTLRRAIVTDCNDRQRAALVELLDGKESAEGVTFNNTKANRDRLHIWQNEQSRRERAAILGEGWEYVSGLHHHTKPGDLVTCLDGTRGRVTKSNPESCVIEFETEDGQRLTVAGYFRYTPSEKSEEEEDPTLTEAEKRDTLCRLWDAAWQQARQDPEGTRVIVETNEEDPSAPENDFGRYYMVDGSESESCIEHAGQWVVIRVDTVTSPYEVRRPNFAAAHGYSDDQTQLACRCENPNNVTRWARKMIDAGRVTDIYADCY
jgi:hypothetical protein